MSIQVTCSCGARLQAPKEAAGRSIRCGKCGKVVTAPAPVAPIAARPNYGKLLLIGGGLGALALGAIVVLGILIALVAINARQAKSRVAAVSSAQNDAENPADVDNADDKALLDPKNLAGDAPDTGKKNRAGDASPRGNKNLADNAPKKSTKELADNSPPRPNGEPGNVAPLPNEPKPQPKPNPPSPGSTANLPKPPTELTFLNITAKGQRFCIIADNSGSMTNSMNFLKRELAKTLGDLKPEGQFHVMFFNDNAEPMPYAGWLQGTPDNVKKVNAWIKGKGANGGTQPLGAFEAAFKLDPKPDVIFFMTDGLIPYNVPDTVAALNKGKSRVMIHTTMFTSDQPLPIFMQAFGTEN